MGENLKVVLAKFSTLSLAVLLCTSTPEPRVENSVQVSSWGQCYKTFYVCNLQILYRTTAFGPGKLFKPGLTSILA